MEEFWFQIFAITFIPEAAARRCSIEKVLPATLLKRGSDTSVFLQHVLLKKFTVFLKFKFNF